ncbi:hydrolase [Streptomyces sp. AN091965]|uniref:hydrolase n=1 Tax=Streptomyces sp. AN091965 TaxID=2927803 RepID=UPI001F614733|nr:hydrolase [Streptomyces sp. AN091965]MCI3928224.1 hydrolase [Streptomyces sp. AN091965]
MSLWTSLEPASATVDPGDSTTVRLRVRNTGDIVDEYHFEPVGDLAPWIAVEPRTLRLYPGTTGTVELTFAPPRTPDATAGPNPYAVRVTPAEHPDAVVVPEGNLTVTAFSEVRAELVPPTVKGRFRGRPRLAVDNLGNTKVTASLSAGDTGDRFSYDIQPGNVQIEPGRAAFVKLTLRPRQISWFGSKGEHPYALAVRRSGTEPTEVDGTFVQRGILPGWLATTFGLLVAVAIAFVMIWLTYQPQVKSVAREKPAEAGKIKPVSPSAPISSAPPAPDEKDDEPAGKPDEGASEKPESGGGGDGGGGGDSEEDEPEEQTAADAVRELAADSEGRHICYRAYVQDDGWQDPVCDGAEAGTVGEDKPIRSLNIAVSGTGGVNATAAYVTEHWRAGDDWKNAGDTEDLYIGDKDSNHPMEGFSISVPDGSVCFEAYAKDTEWIQEVCTPEGKDFYAGAPMEEDRQLEGIRLRA